MELSLTLFVSINALDIKWNYSLVILYLSNVYDDEKQARYFTNTKNAVIYEI